MEIVTVILGAGEDRFVQVRAIAACIEAWRR